jgi:hypothetical protein
VSTSEDHRAAILEEVRLIIVEALRNGDAIRPDALARIVFESYPMSGLSEQQIALGIRGAAAEAGVAVLSGKAEPVRRTAARQ